MDTDGNGQLSWDEINYLCVNSLKKLLPFTNEEEIADISSAFTKFVFKLMGLECEEEIPVELMKDVMSNNESEEVDLLLMMCCAEKNQDERFIEDTIKLEDKELLEKHEDFSQQKNAHFIKEKKKLENLLKVKPNRKMERRSIVIKEAIKLHDDNVLKKDTEDFLNKKNDEKALFEKLKGKAIDRKSRALQEGGNKNVDFELNFAKQQSSLISRPLGY